MKEERKKQKTVPQTLQLHKATKLHDAADFAVVDVSNHWLLGGWTVHMSVPVPPGIAVHVPAGFPHSLAFPFRRARPGPRTGPGARASPLIPLSASTATPLPSTTFIF